MLETVIAENNVLLTENNQLLRQILAAAASPTNVVPMTPAPEKPAAAPAKASSKATKATTLPTVTITGQGNSVATATVTAPEEVEKPTKVEVAAPAQDEFSDPLDPDTKVVVKGDPAPPKIDVDATIAACVAGFKAKMAGATDADRKAELKTAYQGLRDKYGLGADAKLITLAPTPEKLVSLLADIEAL